MNDIYAHTTSLDALKRMLASGNISSLRHISAAEPDKDISVEPLPVPVRFTLPAGKAYEWMRKTKGDNPDKVFLTRNGYLPNYGDSIITKRLGSSVHPHDSMNSIPEEFTTKRKLSLRSNADIYVPDEDVDSLRTAYHGYRIHPKSELPLRPYGLTDRARALYGKLRNAVTGMFDKEAADNSDAQYRRLFGRNARLVGSEALGINVPGSSDTDVFVPYKPRGNFERALGRIANRYPDLALNAASRKREDKKTFTGTVNGRPMDVVIAYGPRAEKFRNAFNAAAETLTPERRAEIVQRKTDLKNAWFFPETRYKMYKKRLAEELGLKDAYF